MTLRANERERNIRERHARQDGWFRWSTPTRFILFIIIVVGLIVGIWSLISESEEPMDPSTLNTIAASNDPWKVKVDEQEILSVRHQDKLVYSRIHKGENVPDVEHFLPVAEAPVAVAPAPVVAPEDVIIVIEEAVEVTSHAKMPKDSIGSLIAQEGGAQGPFIQLGTLDSDEQAQQEWKRLKRRHKDVLGQHSPLIESVDLGERGILYRLRVSYSSLEKAEEVAKELKTRKVGCFVVR